MLVIVIVFGVALLALMALGWRARQRRQSVIAAPETPPAERGDELDAFTGRYVATTLADQPLERVSVHGLGFRSVVTARVYATGVALERSGERDVWIPRDSILGIGRATWTIDRVVEPDGLSVLSWDLGGTAVETALRLDDPSSFDAAFDAVTPAQVPDPTERNPS